jgi:hypothetical protein
VFHAKRDRGSRASLARGLVIARAPLPCENGRAVSEIQHSSENTESVEFLLETGLVVLIDPLALDGLRDTFDAQFASRLVADERTVLSLPPGLRVGVHRVPAFIPGRYCLSRADIEEIEPGDGDDDPAVFDIDTGTLIAADIRCLPVLAQVLTWERYDWLLQSPVDDRSRWDEIVREVGGTMFCILDADIDSPFPGDGRYRLRPQAPRAARASTS